MGDSIIKVANLDTKFEFNPVNYTTPTTDSKIAIKSVDAFNFNNTQNLNNTESYDFNTPIQQSNTTMSQLTQMDSLLNSSIDELQKEIDTLESNSVSSWGNWDRPSATSLSNNSANIQRISQLKSELANLKQLQRQIQYEIELQPYTEIINSQEFKNFVKNYDVENSGFNIEDLKNKGYDVNIYLQEHLKGMGNDDKYSLNHIDELDQYAIFEYMVKDSEGKVNISGVQALGNASLMNGMSEDGEMYSNPANNYYFMTEKQRNIYHYLFQKEGKQSAEHYITLIQDEINMKSGAYYAEQFIQTLDLNNSDVATETILDHFKVSGKGLTDGVDTFFTGLNNAIIANEQLESSDYEKMYILQYLKENSNLLDENYEFSQAMGNMIPAMTAGAIVSCVGTPVAGSMVGSALMGISAEGNAYRQAKIEGHDELSSRTYGIMIGSSEALLGYFLGRIPGISKYSGFTLKNLFMEGTEEFSQEWLDAGFRTVILGEDVNWSEVPENAAKSFVMGVMMAGLCNGGQSVASFTINGRQVSINVEETLKYMEQNPDTDMAEAIKEVNSEFKEIIEGLDKSFETKKSEGILDSLISKVKGKNGKIAGVELFKSLEYDGTPTLVSSDEFQTLSNSSKYGVIVRGISGENSNAYVEQFKYGDMYVGGTHAAAKGTGVYTAYGNDAYDKIASIYATKSGAYPGGSVMEMVLSGDAKVVNFDVIEEEKWKVLDEMALQFSHYDPNIKDFDSLQANLDKIINSEDLEKAKFVVYTLSDTGYYAALRGYDAIDAVDKKYLVILNRGKVIMEDENINGKNNTDNTFTSFYDANTMPLSTDEVLSSAQQKILDGTDISDLSMAEKMKIGRDDVVKEINGYELKSDHVYRAVSVDLYNKYVQEGYISGASETDEYIPGENNGGVDWYLGGAAPKYGEVIIECPADKNYFIPTLDNGSGMAKDPSVRHMKSSGYNNPVPMSMVTVISHPDMNVQAQDISQPKVVDINDDYSTDAVRKKIEEIKQDDFEDFGFQPFNIHEQEDIKSEKPLNPNYLIPLNDDVQAFIDRNNIDVNKVREKVDTTVYSEDDLNSIVRRYGLGGEENETTISIADIVGFDYKYRDIAPEIFASLNSFFDSNGDGYLTRSLKDLNLSPAERAEKLKISFEREPIYIGEIEDGKYVITRNGMHRYSVLRALYLSELAEVTDNAEAIEALNKKYEIPVIARTPNYDLTYSNYIVGSMFSMDLRLEKEERDGWFYPTGNLILTENNHNELILSHEQLIEYIREKCVPLIEESRYTMKTISKKAEEYESFRTYMEKYFPEVLQKSQEIL